MLLGFKTWSRSVALNPLQFHKHFGIKICYLLLLNFDMTSVKTTNNNLGVFFFHTCYHFVVKNAHFSERNVSQIVN